MPRQLLWAALCIPAARAFVPGAIRFRISPERDWTRHVTARAAAATTSHDFSLPIAGKSGRRHAFGKIVRLLFLMPMLRCSFSRVTANVINPEGGERSLADFRGRVILVTNVGKCEHLSAEMIMLGACQLCGCIGGEETHDMDEQHRSTTRRQPLSSSR